MNLTEHLFEQVRGLALQLAGIELRDRHRDLFCSRSRRIGIREVHQLEVMLRKVEDGDPESVNSFIGLVTTKHTGFFRHPLHFEEATQQAVRAIGKRGRALIWCAGAATGEEPFSMAMTLLETFKPRPVPVSIIATDVDPAAIASAQGGEYSELALRNLTTERRERFFHQISQERRWAINPVVRELVEFRVLNLIRQPWSVAGTFDVVFCRNVLMYLEPSYRLDILRRFAALLGPEGILVLDPAEHLGAAGSWYAPGRDGVYAGRPAGLSPKPGLPVAAVVRP